MRAVASRVTEKNDVLLLQAVDMDDSGPYDIAEPRQITALETYTPSWLPCPRLRRLAEIVSQQAALQQTRENAEGATGLGIDQDISPGGHSPRMGEAGSRLSTHSSMIPQPIEGTTRMPTSSQLAAASGAHSDGLPSINE